MKGVIYVNSMTWLAVLVVMLVIEIVTLGLTTIWFAGGALAAFIAALLGAPVIVQVILFIVISVVLLIVTRPIAVKYFNKDRIKTNVDSMIGREGIVISAIDNLYGVGQVIVSGQEWTARSADKEGKIEVGKVVHIVEVQGVKLIVEEIKEEQL